MKKFFAVLCLSLITLCSVGCSTEEITTNENQRVAKALADNINVNPEKWDNVQSYSVDNVMYENVECNSVITIPKDVHRSIVFVKVGDNSSVLFDSDARRITEALYNKFTNASAPEPVPNTNYNSIISTLQTCS